MEQLFFIAFMRPNGAQKAQLKGSVRQFVQNDAFCNLVENVDINDMDARNVTSPGNPVKLAMQARAFTGVPGLMAQVKLWIQSVDPGQRFPKGV